MSLPRSGCPVLIFIDQSHTQHIISYKSHIIRCQSYPKSKHYGQTTWIMTKARSQLGVTLNI